MASLRIPALRYALGSSRQCSRIPQRRWAQVHDVRFLATHQPVSEKIYDKYKEKLDKKAREMGIGDVESLKQAFREKEEAEKKKRIPSPPSAKPPEPEKTRTQKAASYEIPPPPPPQPGVANIPKPYNGLKTLSSFLDVSKTRDLPQREIESLWRLRHASNPQSLSATIPYETYKKLEATARQHPHFILPLAREGQGAEIHFLQWTFPNKQSSTVLFTHLAEYKLRGEFAQPHTTVTHHLELAEEKDVVLLQGQVMENKGVSVDEGQFLLMSLQKFYAGEGLRGELLQKFNTGDESFKVEDVVEEAEKII